MNLEALHIIEQISREKGIAREILIDALKSAIEAAARKKLPDAGILHSEFEEATGEVKIYSEKTVVEEVEDPNKEIGLNEALEMNPEVQSGEVVLVEEILDNYGRIAAQLAKQVIMQKVREAEIDIIYNDFIEKKGEIINGIVQRMEHGDVIVELGNAEGILPRREQVFRETFNRGERIRAYVVDVKKTPKNALIILSRTHTGLIKRLFELEVPEISEGMVEIVGIAREPNGRTKITVRTNDRDIDAVGACVGMRGMRVQSIVQELRGEKIDIVEYSDDPQEFIRNALSPAKISRIIMDEEEKRMTLIVADDQMSLAIGKKGQNVRLAAKLVKWRVDIKGESEAQTLLEQQPFGRQAAPGPPRVDFLDRVKIAKGLGEKMVSILFSGNINTTQDAIKGGLEGLTQLPGIGPKKAEAILNLAHAVEEETAPEEPEETETAEEELATAEETAPDEDSAEEEETEGGEPEEPAAGEDEEEDQDLPVGELDAIDKNTLRLLEENGFQTVAELSVTPLEELTAIDGIDEELAQSIVAQAKLRMEKFENA